MSDFKLLPIQDGKLVTKEALFDSPASMVSMGPVKSGKTRQVANQPKHIILDFEKGTNLFPINNKVSLFVNLEKGENSLETVKFQNFHVPKRLLEAIAELRKCNKMEEFNTLRDAYEYETNPEKLKELKERVLALIKEMTFPIVTVDTLTNGFKDQAYACALANYKTEFEKSAAAQSKNNISKVDNFGGVAFKRASLANLKSFIERYAGPFIIWNGHIALNKDTLSKEDEEITIPDLDLEGKSKNIFTSNCDAVARFYRKDKDGCYLDFQKVGNNDQGTRVQRLSHQKIKIADFDELDESNVTTSHGKTYWERIYPEVYN